LVIREGKIYILKDKELRIEIIQLDIKEDERQWSWL